MGPGTVCRRATCEAMVARLAVARLAAFDERVSSRNVAGGRVRSVSARSSVAFFLRT
eukprot:GDKH01024419.1.p2 GENE.GDKH01024419.1~~GDKH01024419.1.p2  ORF type:complete len:57 (+),score=2.29 GDKH01024419.1:1-171(+)